MLKDVIIIKFLWNKVFIKYIVLYLVYICKFYWIFNLVIKISLCKVFGRWVGKYEEEINF